jgi:hypothetical protein
VRNKTIVRTTVLDMNKWERRKIRQRALEQAVRGDYFDRRSRRSKLSDAKLNYDRFLGSLRRAR